MALEPCDTGLRIVTPMLTAEIAAEGEWTMLVQIGGFALASLAKLIGAGHRVKIGFAGDRIFVNCTSILVYEGTAPPQPVVVRAGAQEMLPGMGSPRCRRPNGFTTACRGHCGLASASARRGLGYLSDRLHSEVVPTVVGGRRVPAVDHCRHGRLRPVESQNGHLGKQRHQAVDPDPKFPMRWPPRDFTHVFSSGCKRNCAEAWLIPLTRITST